MRKAGSSGLWALILLMPTPGIAAPAGSAKAFAERIYESLKRVTGDGRPAPQLEVVPAARRLRDRQVAWFDMTSGRIGIEEKTIEVCRTMSGRAEACVAFFLGHELAHFYKDHAWGADFGSRFAATPLAARLRELSRQQRLEFEAQADDAGGIYGYLAGYDAAGAAGAVLRRIYKEYSIPDTSPDYPSLAEREEIARASAARLRRFIPVFEAGNLLFALGRYEDAAGCMDYVARFFPGREILNNAAIARAVAAGSPDAGNYPWLLDTQTRLSLLPRQRGAEAPAEARRREMLESSLQNLQEAARRDPGYVPAIVNLSLINDLLGRHRTAIDDATRALGMINTGGSEPASAVSAAHLARAIAYIHLGQPAEAQADFSAVADDWVAAYWKAIANGQTTPLRRLENAEKPGPPESLAAYRAAVTGADTAAIQIGPGLQLRSTTTPQFLNLVIAMSNGRLRALLIRDYDGSTARGLRRGAGIEAVQQAYGDPSRLHHTAAGTWFVYDRARLIVRLNPAGAVGGWAVYAWQE